MAEDLVYFSATPDRFEDVIDHLRYNFFADEPLNKSMALTKPGERIPELEEYSRNVLKQNMSSIVTTADSNEVVGAVLVGTPIKDTIKEYNDPKLQKIFKFIETMVKSCDTGFDETEIAELKILSVDDKMRGRGIASRLYKLGEQTAVANGFKAMRAEATALFSQKILEKNGWETMRKVTYSEYPCPDAPLFKVDPPHESLQIMLKRL